MIQPIPFNGFDWIEDLFKIDEDFIKTMIKIAIKDIFLKYILNILKIYMIGSVIYYSYQKEE